jgi:hypothetical protein
MELEPKTRIILILSCFLIIGIGSAVITYYVGLEQSKNDSHWEDDYYSIKFHKDYHVFSLPYNLEDGKQYDYMLVDKFLPRTESQYGTYGVINVNESTGKLEFNTFKPSKNSRVVTTLNHENKSVNDADSNMEFDIVLFPSQIWKIRQNSTPSYNKTEFQWFSYWYEYVDRGKIVGRHNDYLLIYDYVFGLTFYHESKIHIVKKIPKDEIDITTITVQNFY